MSAITRRRLLGWLPGGLLGLGQDRRAGGLAATRAFRVDAFYIAGYRYHEGLACEGDLRAGQGVRLVGEPENPCDERAVRVEWVGRHLGYVPRGQNRVLCRMLAAGAPLQARIAKINAGEPTWRRVKITVEIEAVLPREAA